MALPLIMGLLGSTLGAGATSGVLATLGSVGAGALGSGLGRFLETGDLEEGLKTGAMSFAGGTALKGLLGGMGGQAADKAAGQAFQPTYGSALTAEGLGKAGADTFGSQLMNVAQNPISQGQAILAQSTVPPPMPKKPDPVEFENRQAGIPRNVDRRPPPDYRPGYDGEFDYGITPNYGVGLMSEDDPLYMSYGGLVRGTRDFGGTFGNFLPRVMPRPDYTTVRPLPGFGRRSGLRDLGNDIRSRVGNRTEEDVEKFVGDVDNMAKERFDVNLSEPNPRFKGAFSGKGQLMAQRQPTNEVTSNAEPRAMNMGGLVGLLGNEKVQDALSNVVGISLNPAMQREANKLMTGEFTPEGYSPLTMADVGMQEGGMAEIMAPNVEDSKELQTIIIRAARALQGATENPEKDIQLFVEKFGMQALNDLRQRVASGELSFGRDGGIRGMISGEGDGMSDSIEAEIVESAGDPSGSGRPLQVANNEYVVAADVVSDIGNGSSEAGAAKLDRLMKDVRLARHGTTEQPEEKDMMSVMKKAIS